jgi:MFS family permease
VAVGGLVSGWALDRFDRRKLLTGDSLIRAIAMVSVPFAAATGHLVAGQLSVVAAIYGALKMTSLAGWSSRSTLLMTSPDHLFPSKRKPGWSMPTAHAETGMVVCCCSGG